MYFNWRFDSNVARIDRDFHDFLEKLIQRRK